MAELLVIVATGIVWVIVVRWLFIHLPLNVMMTILGAAWGVMGVGCLRLYIEAVASGQVIGGTLVALMALLFFLGWLGVVLGIASDA